MAVREGGDRKWSTTVIMSSSLQGHEVAVSLQSQQHKVRFSDSVENGLFIFPLSGIAFLLTDAKQLFATSKETIFERVQKFISVHRNSFLGIEAALFGSDEWNLIFRIQQRFLGSNLRILPVHNNAETVKIILTIAKVTCKPHIENIRDRLQKAKTHIVENSPVWKTLDQI
ncbi:protein SPO16 homolog [Pelobates fuscus]|uniref:protein SPO16 homolog n=1 Tax=Pelobates fuscus TaxID=191477 RepID=UPI002FE4604B